MDYSEVEADDVYGTKTENPFNSHYKKTNNSSSRRIKTKLKKSRSAKLRVAEKNR